MVVNGCSLTYCQELEDPKTQGWPALLAKKLGVPVVNLAYCGSGNDGIARRSMEYFFKDRKNNNKPFYIHAWSYLTRREDVFQTVSGEIVAVDIKSSSHELIASANICIPDDIKQTLTVSESLINLSLNIAERKKMFWWITMMNFFKSNSIPFLMSDYMPTDDVNVTAYINDYYPEMRDYIDQDHSRLINFNSLTEKFPKMPQGHDGYEAQHILADYIYSEIIKRYGEVRFQNIDYYKLSEFYSYKDLTHNLEWT